MPAPSDPRGPTPAGPPDAASPGASDQVPVDQASAWDAKRDRVIGLGERSIRKSYYPELVQRLGELERFRALLDHSRDGILLLEVPGLRIVDATAAACSQLGASREALLALSLGDLVPASAVTTIRASIESDPAGTEGCTLSTGISVGGDRVLPVEISVRPVRFGDSEYAVAVARDISERLELEAQLLQAAKMESLGRLAGGVAHDFNNLLTAILGNGEIARTYLLEDDPVIGFLDEIAVAGERAAALVRQLLVFARRQTVSPVRLNLSSLVAESEGMLRRLLGEDIEVTTRLEADLATLVADPSQMHQLLVNLTVNARDAMADGGRLVVGTATVIVEPGSEDTGLRPGRHVELTVSDTGVGMTPETIAHIFEPFYTTKDLGKGTGLGLATCHGIVRQAGGAITVASEPGVGTTFRILLPATDAAPDPVPAGGPGSTGDRGTETILVVEDDEAIRRLAVAGLEARGYRVLEAAHAGQALAIARDHAFDLVVSDVVMPGMNGAELGRQLAELRPQARLILASGHPRVDPDTHGSPTAHGDDEGERSARSGAAPGMDPAAGPADFLPKPYTPEQLARRVRHVLDTRDRPT